MVKHTQTIRGRVNKIGSLVRGVLTFQFQNLEILNALKLKKDARFSSNVEMGIVAYIFAKMANQKTLACCSCVK